MSLKSRDEKINKTLINLFKELENIDVKIQKHNKEIYKHISSFEDPGDSKEPIKKIL